METTINNFKVEELVSFRDDPAFLAPNPEYQRGEVWTRDQQMKMIDSVLRGYQLPLIYLHDIERINFG